MINLVRFLVILLVGMATGLEASQPKKKNIAMSVECRLFLDLITREQVYYSSQPKLLKTFVVGFNNNPTFNPYTKQLVMTRVFNSMATLVDFETETVVKRWLQKDEDALFSPNGTKVAFFSQGILSSIQDLKAQSSLIREEDSLSESEDLKAITKACFSADGEWLVVGDEKGAVVVLEAGSLNVLHQLSPTNTFNGPISSVAISADKSKLIMGNKNGNIKIYSIKEGKSTTFGSEKTLIADSAFSPDGKKVAVAYGDKVKVLDVNAFKRLYTLQESSKKQSLPNSILSVAFSPDGKKIATGSYEKSVKLWDSVTGKQLSTLEDTEPVDAVHFDPFASDQLYTVTNKTVKLWTF